MDLHVRTCFESQEERGEGRKEKENQDLRKKVDKKIQQTKDVICWLTNDGDTSLF